MDYSVFISNSNMFSGEKRKELYSRVKEEIEEIERLTEEKIILDCDKDYYLEEKLNALVEYESERRKLIREIDSFCVNIYRKKTSGFAKDITKLCRN